jgi:hypothetical protein
MNKREHIRADIQQVIDQYLPNTLYAAARTAASRDEDETGAYTDLIWKHQRVSSDTIALVDSIASLHEDITTGRYAFNAQAHGHLLVKADRFPATDEHED